MYRWTAFCPPVRITPPLLCGMPLANRILAQCPFSIPSGLEVHRILPCLPGVSMSPVCPLIPYAEVFMTEFISIVAIVALIFLFIKIISLPMRLIFKILINAASGFVCLFLLNMLAE